MESVLPLQGGSMKRLITAMTLALVLSALAHAQAQARNVEDSIGTAFDVEKAVGTGAPVAPKTGNGSSNWGTGSADMNEGAQEMSDSPTTDEDAGTMDVELDDEADIEEDVE